MKHTFKKTAALALASVTVLMVLAFPARAEYSTQHFTDVVKTHWAFQQVEFVYDKKIMIGVGNNLFHPSAAITQEQFVVTIVRAINKGDPAGSTAGGWSDPHYAYAQANNLLANTNLTKSTKRQPMLRKDMAVVLMNAAAKRGVDTNQYKAYKDTVSYPRGGSYDKAIGFCYATGLLKGKGTYFGGNDTMTRAEIATVVQRLMNLDTSGTPVVPDTPSSGSRPATFAEATVENINNAVITHDSAGNRVWDVLPVTAIKSTTNDPKFYDLSQGTDFAGSYTDLRYVERQKLIKQICTTAPEPDEKGYTTVQEWANMLNAYAANPNETRSELGQISVTDSDELSLSWLTYYNLNDIRYLLNKVGKSSRHTTPTYPKTENEQLLRDGKLEVKQINGKNHFIVIHENAADISTGDCFNKTRTVQNDVTGMKYLIYDNGMRYQENKQGSVVKDNETEPRVIFYNSQLEQFLGSGLGHRSDYNEGQTYYVGIFPNESLNMGFGCYTGGNVNKAELYFNGTKWGTFHIPSYGDTYLFEQIILTPDLPCFRYDANKGLYILDYNKFTYKITYKDGTTKSYNMAAGDSFLICNDMI